MHELTHYNTRSQCCHSGFDENPRFTQINLDLVKNRRSNTVHGSCCTLFGAVVMCFVMWFEMCEQRDRQKHNIGILQLSWGQSKTISSLKGSAHVKQNICCKNLQKFTQSLHKVEKIICNKIGFGGALF